MILFLSLVLFALVKRDLRTAVEDMAEAGKTEVVHAVVDGEGLYLRVPKLMILLGMGGSWLHGPTTNTGGASPRVDAREVNCEPHTEGMVTVQREIRNADPNVDGMEGDEGHRHVDRARR